ncbi:hypothetical protein Esti_000624 [Eimeria stiedai]
MQVEQVNRSHRVKQAGSKAARQARRKKKKDLGSVADDKRHNPKAFTFSGGVISVQRRVQHSLDKATAKKHKPIIDKTPGIAPPYTVVVQGPPGVGKSLLIRCLTRHYARRTVGAIRGPVTVVASKIRRLTFVECPNDACGMIDASKVADIALVLIDAQYGFEMETFEFINMMQTHGMPRVIGVLTHLDTISDKKALKRRRKDLKARFWSELYDGAKLFFLSGLKNGRYHNRDILNLARFVSVQKVRPMQWRAAHPYLLALKADYANLPAEVKNREAKEQLETEEAQLKQQQQHERHFVLYGYVRGAVLRAGHSVHIPGAGDFPIISIAKCEDPCPAPGKEEENGELFPGEEAEADADSGPSTAAAKKKRRSRAARSLKDKQRCIFGPYCDIGGLTLDEDAMYIHLPDNKISFTPKAHLANDGKTGSGGDDSNSDTSSSSGSDSSESELPDQLSEESEVEFDVSSDNTSDSNTSYSASEAEDEEAMGPAIRMVRELQSADKQLNIQLQSQKLELLNTSTRCINPAAPPPRRIIEPEAAAEPAEHLFFSDESAEEGRWAGAQTDSDTSASDSEEDLGDLALQHIKGSRTAQPSLGDMVYGRRGGAVVQSHEARKCIKTKKDGRLRLFEDLDNASSESDENLDDEELGGENGSAGLSLYGNLPLPPSASGLSPELDSGDALAEEAAAIYRALGLDPGDATEVEAFWNPDLVASIKKRFFITGGWQELEEAKEAANKPLITADEGTMTEQEQRKKEERQQGVTAARKTFENSENAMGGFSIGTFVKICIANLPEQWLDNFDPSRPVLVGGINAGEIQCTFMQLRLRKHRWSPRILKSNDPLLFSAGWRRFQSLPVYAMEDRGETRVKYLKYTPEHLHCLAYIYAPALPPSTPFLAIRDTRAIASHRIVASGVVLQTTPDPKVQKKLKLIGEAKKIFKNTAFIKGMFNSDLEVNRCIGAKVQTASGIRGQIKKALGSDGTFRASFEDKILMSDLVICKAWIAISPLPFFNPVLDVAGWRRLRTQAEIRQAKDLPLPFKDDNLLPYGGHARVQRKFNPMKIPKQLALKLPFHARPKASFPETMLAPLQAPTSRLKKLKGKKLQDEKDMQKPVVSAYDKRVAALLQRLQTIRNAREKQRKEKQQEKLKAKRKVSAKVEAERKQKQQQIRKKRYVKKGKIEMGMRRRLRLGNSGDE